MPQEHGKNSKSTVFIRVGPLFFMPIMRFLLHFISVSVCTEHPSTPKNIYEPFHI